MDSLSEVSLDFKELESVLTGMARTEVMARDILDKKLRRGSLLLISNSVMNLSFPNLKVITRKTKKLKIGSYSPIIL
jgi:hypothetical protein